MDEQPQRDEPRQLGRPGEGLHDALITELDALIDAYDRERGFLDHALRELARLRADMEQRPAEEEDTELAPRPVAAPPPQETRVAQQAIGTGRLQEFIEGLADVPGVARISVLSPGPGRASLFVELLEGDGEFEGTSYEDAESNADGFTIACAGCGRVLSEGGPQVSHTFCEDCVRRLLSD